MQDPLLLDAPLGMDQLPGLTTDPTADGVSVEVPAASATSDVVARQAVQRQPVDDLLEILRRPAYDEGLDVPLHPSPDAILGPKPRVPLPALPSVPRPAMADPANRALAALAAGLALGAGPKSGYGTGAARGLEQAFQAQDSMRLRQYQIETTAAVRGQQIAVHQQAAIDRERAAKEKLLQSGLDRFLERKKQVESADEYRQLVTEESAKWQSAGFRGLTPQWFEQQYPWVDPYGKKALMNAIDRYSTQNKQRLALYPDAWITDRLTVRLEKDAAPTELSVFQAKRMLGQDLDIANPRLSTNKELNLSREALAIYKEKHGYIPNFFQAFTPGGPALRTVAQTETRVTPAAFFQEIADSVGQLRQKQASAAAANRTPLNRLQAQSWAKAHGYESLDQMRPADWAEYNKYQSEAQQLTPQAQATLTLQMRRDWQRLTTAANGARYYGAIINSAWESYKRGDRANASEAMILAFKRVIEPGSVVMPSEFTRSEALQSIFNRIQGTVEQYGKGGAAIPEPVMAQMVQTTRDLVQNIDHFNDNQKAPLAAMAQKYRIPSSWIFGDERPSQLPVVTNAPAPSVSSARPGASGAIAPSPSGRVPTAPIAGGRANPSTSRAPTPPLEGLAPGARRLFREGPFSGQTWTVDAAGTPRRIQ